MPPSPYIPLHLTECMQQQLIDANQREYGRIYKLLTFELNDKSGLITTGPVSHVLSATAQEVAQVSL